MLVARAESLYVAQVRALHSDAQRLIEEWIAQNSFEALRGLQDAGELSLLQKIRGVFSAPRGLSSFFGKLSSLVDEDVLNVMDQTIPIIPRGKLVRPRALDQYTKRNAALIKDVGDTTTDRIAVIMKGGAEGRHTKALQRQFQEAFDVSESRAKLWARDQTLKLHGQLTKERHKQVGIDRYFWTDSNDERTREIHRLLGERSDKGETFAYDDPPICAINPERRANPGEDYQCRCTAFPAL